MEDDRGGDTQVTGDGKSPTVVLTHANPVISPPRPHSDQWSGVAHYLSQHTEVGWMVWIKGKENHTGITQAKII